MSSYIDVVHPDRHAPYLDIPNDVIEYLHYLDFVKLRSPRTVNGYYLDLRGFFRYMMLQWDRADDAAPPEKIDLTGISTRDIAGITKRDIFGYLDYARNADNGPKARARKLSALKGFFHYMCTQVNKLTVNPTENISLGTPQKALPKYLTENEAVELLKNIQSDFYERDYCIITLFLNCGMRLAELVTIDLSDFRDDTIRIVGKGNKERLVYLNDACLFSLQRYKKARAALPNLADKDALFVSKRTGKAISLSDLLDEIPVDAARYFFNAKPDTQMDFDLGLAVRQDSENPVYYVQYAHARICSMLANLAAEGLAVPAPAEADMAKLVSPFERELIKQIAMLPEEIHLAARDYDPSRINRYVTELAARFHRFYNVCRIKDAEPAVRDARLKLADTTRRVLEIGLGIIGVTAPEKM